MLLGKIYGQGINLACLYEMNFTKVRENLPATETTTTGRDNDDEEEEDGEYSSSIRRKCLLHLHLPPEDFRDE